MRIRKGVLARFASAVLAATVATSLLLMNVRPVAAIVLSISGLPSAIVQGGSATFTVTANIDAEELVPIQSLQLSVTGATSLSVQFAVDGTILTGSSPHFSSITPVTNTGVGYTAGYGYGYLQGYETLVGYSTFGYGYGYGYVDGQVGYLGSPPAVLSYTVVLNTGAAPIMPLGQYSMTFRVNTGDTEKPAFVSSATSFAIVNPPSTGGGGGPPSTGGTQPVTVTATAGQQATATFTVNTQGVVQQTVNVNVPLTAGQGTVSVSIPTGTVAKDAQGAPLAAITAQEHVGALPSAPGGQNVIGVPVNFGPNGSTFNPAIPISFTLPPGQSAAGKVIALYNVATGQWVTLSNITIVGNTITGYTDHFTLFSVVELVAPTPTPTATPRPTATPVPTATPPPAPTATPVRPTATPVPPTATPVAPTVTPQPTATPVPPTATPVPPTATRPPTAVPPQPTATTAPVATATPQPTATRPVAPTATPVPPPPPPAQGFPVWAIVVIVVAVVAAGAGAAWFILRRRK